MSDATFMAFFAASARSLVFSAAASRTALAWSNWVCNWLCVGFSATGAGWPGSWQRSIAARAIVATMIEKLVRLLTPDLIATPRMILMAVFSRKVVITSRVITVGNEDLPTEGSKEDLN